jgi:hypothetical protein
MKKVARILLLSIIVLTVAVITITACGGSRSSGGPRRSLNFGITLATHTARSASTSSLPRPRFDRFF